ncbi:DegT/DnrJ/EryC1/StrS family aminotransferase [Roseobacter weihaiensis]|uniref:DegT/DnrJ/EryC1/StrS family aminotransferase n=1 Tax=Roseobacter weihaiensis TaxID=2763262 RepID=UPI001D0BE216|nr:DegT/DnrJ/EryC1/StrS family aminotransferase [Roseobacter sp. H9]
MTESNDAQKKVSVIVDRYDYPSQFDCNLDRIVDQIRHALLDGEYVLSKQVARFEASFAKFVGVKHALGVNSGTDALILALMACGVGRDAEVIIPANTFYATAAAVCFVGARPVLVDPDPKSFLMTAASVRAAISENTRAIIPVHLYGKVCQMSELRAIADDINAVLIEDSAQAHGGVSPDGEPAGTIGDISCFSFHPSKNLAAAGDAGAVCTSSDAIAEKVRWQRALGQRGPNVHDVLGINSKLDAIQAIILDAKLPRLAAWNVERANIAKSYREALADLPVSFQKADDNERHVYHLFQIRTRHRDELFNHLTSNGIDAVIRYPDPIHLQEAFAMLGYVRGDFPVAEDLARELLALPIRPGLTAKSVEHVVRVMNNFSGY